MIAEAQRARLSGLARKSILHGLRCGSALTVELGHWAEWMQGPGASFVTLHRDDALRGCIGSLQPSRPLVVDVAENAFAAAFRDPRFPPLAPDEMDDLSVHISILSAPEELLFESEDDLATQLRPGVDGLILREGKRRGTFLPSVWGSLPDRHDFLKQLKRKAGLPADYWSDRLQIERYTAESW